MLRPSRHKPSYVGTSCSTCWSRYAGWRSQFKLICLLFQSKGHSILLDGFCPLYVNYPTQEDLIQDLTISEVTELKGLIQTEDFVGNRIVEWTIMMSSAHLAYYVAVILSTFQSTKVL